jgi:pimeloyl-ACP methyl ester carboxylesterase
LHERFSLYALTRAEGGWLSWIYKGRKKDFLRDCSLRDRSIPASYPPALLIHGAEDPDVPFAESQKLSILLPRARLSPRITTRHDFDADPSSPAAKTCILESIAFLLEQTPASM